MSRRRYFDSSDPLGLHLPRRRKPVFTWLMMTVSLAVIVGLAASYALRTLNL